MGIAVRVGWTGPVVACLLYTFTSTALSSGIQYDAARNEIRVRGGGTVTLTAIKLAVPQAPLELVDRKRAVWLLGAGLILEDGSGLQLHGTALGGDVNELRLRSLNASAPRSLAYVLADHGRLDLARTRVLSWDPTADGPDREHATFGRAWIEARSRWAQDGTTPLQSVLRIRESEVAHLGYDAPGRYGLAWAGPDPDGGISTHASVERSVIVGNFIGGHLRGVRGLLWVDSIVTDAISEGLVIAGNSDDPYLEGNTFHAAGDPLMIEGGSERAVIKSNLFGSSGDGRLRFSEAPGALFNENILPAEMVVQLSGSFAHRTSVEFRLQPRINLDTDTYSTGLFRDVHNAVFDVDGSSSLSTDSVVHPTDGSELALRFPATVFRRAFFAYPSSAILRVNPFFWSTEESTNKGWLARSGSATQSVGYRVGDLEPGALYAVHQGATHVGDFEADTSGFIEFSVVPGVTSTVRYSVNRYE